MSDYPVRTPTKKRITLMVVGTEAITGIGVVVKFIADDGSKLYDIWLAAPDLHAMFEWSDRGGGMQDFVESEATIEQFCDVLRLSQ